MPRLTPYLLIPALAAQLALPLAAEDVALTIDDTKPLRTIAGPFSGTNFCALWNNTGASPGTKKALSQLGVKMLRFPGGVPCQWYDWQDPLGTGWTTITPDIAWDLAQGGGAEMMFQTNCAGNGYKNKAGQPGTFDSSGAHMADWAKAAKAAGIKVAWWEIGNEPELDAPGTAKANQDTIFQWYNAKFAEQAKAIHDADPQAKCMGPASCNTWFWWHERNIEKFLAAHGNKQGDGLADGVSIHWYPDAGGAAWEQARGYAQGWKACWDYLSKQIADFDSRPLPLYITEWNWGAGDKNLSAYALSTALGNADCVGMFLRTGVAGHTHFVLQHVDHGWGMLATKGEGRGENWAAPTYYALAIADRMGNQPLPVTNPVDEGNVMSCYATKDGDGGMQVMLINKCERTLTANLSFTAFKAAGKEAQVYTLVGASGKVQDQDVVYNEVPTPKPWEEDLPAPKPMKVGAALTRDLAPYSLTLITFAGSPQAKVEPKPSLAPADRKALDAATDAAVARTIKRTIKAASSGSEPSTIIDFRHKPVPGTVQSATEEEVTVKLDIGSIQLPWSTLQPASFHALAKCYAREGAPAQTWVDYAALCISTSQLEQGRQALASARLAAKKDAVEGLDVLQRALEYALANPPEKPKAQDKPADKPAADPKAKGGTDAKTDPKAAAKKPTAH